MTAQEVPAFLAAAMEQDGKNRWKDVPEYHPLFLGVIHTGMMVGEAGRLPVAG